MLYLLTLVVFAVPLAVYGVYRKDFRVTVLRVGAVGTVIGAIWDWVAVNVFMLWSFNPKTIVGIWILSLPLEEWLFFPLVSMSLATLTLILKKT
ncbi:MAG: lycopene cyclase domain-containing protein [Candidatus Bathyarchaeota archaeon]|nr:lycopene cyclase domain-containing protein [Candidatus Bathyarchaeota archaeon]